MNIACLHSLLRLRPISWKEVCRMDKNRQQHKTHFTSSFFQPQYPSTCPNVLNCPDLSNNSRQEPDDSSKTYDNDKELL